MTRRNPEIVKGDGIDQDPSGDEPLVDYLVLHEKVIAPGRVSG
jgi:hypothetical protein